MGKGCWTIWPLLGALLACSPAPAQTNDRSALTDLDRQTQSLYRQVSHGVVRAQLPTTRPTAVVQLDRLERWAKNLSPEALAFLRNELKTPGVTVVAHIVPGAPPVLELRQINPTLQSPTNPAPLIAPNVVGVVVDDQGDVLLPAFTPTEAVAGRAIPVVLSDGTVRPSRFIGSDALSNITVIQIQDPVANLAALQLGAAAPPEGALVMFSSIDPAMTRLGIWTRWSMNQGIVIRTDGTVAGFSGSRQFVAAAAYLPAVRQLIQNGRVHRPILGVVIRWVPANDPQRDLDPALGQSPAIRIFSVIPDSPASRAGLRTGDLILSLAGQPVSDSQSFATAIAARTGPTELQILRSDQHMTVTVELGK